MSLAVRLTVLFTIGLCCSQLRVLGGGAARTVFCDKRHERGFLDRRRSS
jgi:hypothetical protein